MLFITENVLIHQEKFLFCLCLWSDPVEEIEKVPPVKYSQEVTQRKSGFFRRFCVLFKKMIFYPFQKIEEFSFLKAVFIGIFLGVFAFGSMLLIAALWLVRY
ncbi:hypothetical protein FAI40_07275 [Acetobacteraceae bacterium]|nr:hypothetical protein FAI40_07275 [Acetobacteraceae bacterium]